MRRLAGIAVVVLLCSTASMALAQDEAAIDPIADHLLRRMNDFLANADELRFHAEVTEDEEFTAGVLLELQASVDVAVKRPGRARADERGSRGDKRYWLTAGEFVLEDTATNTYARTSSLPASTNDALDVLWEGYGLLFPLADLLRSDLYATLVENATDGYYVGSLSVDGARLHHLAFVTPTVDWQIWIADGQQVLPHRVVIVYKREPHAPRFAANLTAWNLSPGLTDAHFDFVALPGAREIELARDGDDSGN